MVTFKDGKQFETIAVYGGTMTFQGANRETLEFRIAEENAEFDELKALLTDAEALSEIEITEGADGEVLSLHLNYTLPVELALRENGGASVWCLKLAQKSAFEIALEKQAADINDTQLALIEIAGMIGGEVDG